MSEGDFTGIEAGTYYANKDFQEREKSERREITELKNRTTVRHGMLNDLKVYLEQSGWVIQPTKGRFEVLRAVNKNYPRPLLVHDRLEIGCGYSIDERDAKIYAGWKRNRKRRGIDPDRPHSLRCEPERCKLSCGQGRECGAFEYGYCTSPYRNKIGRFEVNVYDKDGDVYELLFAADSKEEAIQAAIQLNERHIKNNLRRSDNGEPFDWLNVEDTVNGERVWVSPWQ